MPPRSGPYVAGRAQLLAAAKRAQLDCLRLPSAHSLFAGRATRYADGKSYSDRPAPTATWRAALGEWPVADRAQRDRSHSSSAHHYSVGSAVLHLEQVHR